MKKIYCLLFSILGIYNLAVAQQFQITGTVKDTNGNPVSFASVYLKNTSKGVSANVNGDYSLTLNQGDATIVVKAIGYKAAENQITVTKNAVLNITLTEEAYTLNSVNIVANAEDPAYQIMRQAIKKRKQHLNEVDAYSADVYIKGLQKLVGAPKKFFGRDIQKTLDLDTNRKGILYLSESQSKFSFKKPNQINEEMVSSKVSGNNNAFSFNKASDLLINFYENLMLENSGLSARSFVSPIADNALFYYKYKLLGTTEENGETVNKIQVTPRRNNDPAFKGIIYIADDSWRLIGTNLNLTKSAGINFVDSLNIAQQFVKVANVYMPTSCKFEFNGNVFGFKFAGYFVGIFSNYNVNPKFAKNFFTAEILKVTKAVNKKDSLYWVNNRPIPLTIEESFDYKKKDSIALRKTTKSYLDSIENANNKFKISKLLLTGYTINNRFEKKYYTFDPIIGALLYNTVEGLAMQYGVTYRKNLADRKFFSIRPEARYGFSNQIFTANLSANYYYNPIKRASVNVSIGSSILDLNRLGTIELLGNSINSLFYERNFLKLYRKEFINVGTNRELANGLQASAGLEYSKNYDLVNTSTYKIRDIKDREFTSNNPFTPNSETALFPDYTALTLNAGLTYTFGQKFVTRPDGKFYEQSKYPRLQLAYRKGVNNLLGSDVDYDLINFEIYQERISAGLLGYSSFTLSVGKFLNNTSVYYPDFKHFRGNNTLVFNPNLRRFRYLDFYRYSTNNQYFEGHFEHNFAGFVTNKIPLLRKLKLEEFVGVSYLSQPLKTNYTEVYFGLQRLILNVSYGFSFDGNKKIAQGLRISYGF